jgi:predicted short-subunit dehydrogenase-like oxidoreductase (DUF2520 family)
LKKVLIIGCGKLGTALAVDLQNAGFEISVIIENNKSRTNKLKKYFKKTIFSEKIKRKLLQIPNIIFISVQDKKIISIIKELNRFREIKNKLIIHSSGMLNLDVFTVLKSQNIGVLHPIQTFNKISISSSGLLNGIYFGIKTTKMSDIVIKSIVKKLSSNYIKVSKKNKALYHTICVFASNLLVGYFSLLEKLFNEIFHNETDFMTVFKSLIERTYKNILLYGINDSLTGPFIRGDIDTIHENKKSLLRNTSNFEKLFCILGKECLEISFKRKEINRTAYNQILKLLEIE